MGANSLNTEDYMYLINNRDIITTCQEALRENDLSFPSAILSDKLITDQSSDAKSTSTGTCSTAEKSTEGTGATVTDYADWIKHVEKELDNVCYCNISATKPVPSEASEGHRTTKTDANDSVTSESDFAAGVNIVMSSTPIKKDATSQLKRQVWRPVVERHRAIQAEVRSVGLRFKSILQDIANKKDASPSSAKQLRVLESRWHKLWLRSLESLMLIEECKCPNHLSGREKLPSSSIASSSTSTYISASATKDRVRRQVLDQLEKISSPGVELTATPSSQQTSGFYSSSSLLLTSPTQLQQEQEPPSSGSSDQTSVKKEKPLKTSTSTSFTSGDFLAGQLISVKNRRVQTMGGQDLQDMKDSKFEVIQKDIGYSSDADMSDAYDARPQTDYINLSTSRNSSQRKRQFRRRQRSFQRLSPSCSTGNLDLSFICQGRNRPWSFHASSEWTDSWDYYIPPSSIHPQSSEDLSSSSPYDDDDTVRRITEFGENYEYWLKPDDVIIGLRDGIHRPPPPPLSILTGTDVGSSGEPHLSLKKEVSTMTSHATPVECHNEEMNKKRGSSRAYAIFVTFSLVSIILSLFFTSSYPPHLDLEYKSPPPL